MNPEGRSWRVLDCLRRESVNQCGYEPRAARDLWQCMDEASRGASRPPEFLSTHPLPATRIRQIEAWLSEAMGYYRPR